jgi:hypothetical protein
LNARIAWYAAAIIGIVGLTSCTSPTRTDELAAARARWAANGATTYVVESRIRCFCPAHLSVWTRLSIRDNQVMTAEPLEPLPSGAVASTSGWQTVTQLFDVVDRRAADDAVSSVAARYHQTSGYPEEITVTCRPNVTDCGVIYELRNFVR